MIYCRDVVLDCISFNTDVANKLATDFFFTCGNSLQAETSFQNFVLHSKKLSCRKTESIASLNCVVRKSNRNDEHKTTLGKNHANTG